ncbi:MAG: hypothetical protein RR543_04410 [Erysipelotrichales bacterium]
MKKRAFGVLVIMLLLVGCKDASMAGKYIDSDLIEKSLNDNIEDITSKKQKVNGTKFFRIGYVGKSGCLYKVLDTKTRGSLSMYAIDPNKDQGAKSKTKDQCLAIGKKSLYTIFPKDKKKIDLAIQGKRQTVEQGGSKYIITYENGELGFMHSGLYESAQ